MKKIISLILAISVLAALFLPLCTFATELPLTITCAGGEYEKTDEIRVNVVLSNNPGFMLLMLTPSFSPELQLVSVENGDIISDLTKGIRYLWLGNDDTNANGVLATFVFKLKENASYGDYDISFTLGDCYNSNEESVAAQVVPGTIKISRKQAQPIEEANKNIAISNMKEYKVSVDGVESSYNSELYCKFPIGAQVTVTAVDAENFAYWRNSSNNIISRNASFSFTVSVSEVYTAVYNNKMSGKVTVIYKSLYDQVLFRAQLAPDDVDNIELPEVPVKYAYTAVGWEKDKTALKAAVQAALATTDETDDVIEVVPEYVLTESLKTITVNGGSGSGVFQAENYTTIVANQAPSGKKFSHWIDENGNIVSYRDSYTFFVNKDKTFTAIYVDNGVEVNPTAVCEIQEVVRNAEGNSLIFASFANVPDGFVIEAAGIVATADATIGQSEESFSTSTAQYPRYSTTTSTSLRYLWTKTNVQPTDVWYVRAFVTFTDLSGNINTIYGDIISASLNA